MKQLPRTRDSAEGGIIDSRHRLLPCHRRRHPNHVSGDSDMPQQCDQDGQPDLDEQYQAMAEEGA